MNFHPSSPTDKISKTYDHIPRGKQEKAIHKLGAAGALP